MKKSKTILTCAAAACLLVSGIGFACARARRPIPRASRTAM